MVTGFINHPSSLCTRGSVTYCRDTHGKTVSGAPTPCNTDQECLGHVYANNGKSLSLRLFTNVRPSPSGPASTWGSPWFALFSTFPDGKWCWEGMAGNGWDISLKKQLKSNVQKNMREGQSPSCLRTWKPINPTSTNTCTCDCLHLPQPTTSLILRGNRSGCLGFIVTVAESPMRTTCIGMAKSWQAHFRHDMQLK